MTRREIRADSDSSAVRFKNGRSHSFLNRAAGQAGTTITSFPLAPSSCGKGYANETLCCGRDQLWALVTSPLIIYIFGLETLVQWSLEPRVWSISAADMSGSGRFTVEDIFLVHVRRSSISGPTRWSMNIEKVAQCMFCHLWERCQTGMNNTTWVITK